MSKYSILPRTDLTYCYICNAQIFTSRAEGEEEKLQKQLDSQPFHNFLQARDLDIVPITCTQPTCLDQYARLPKTRYYEENFPLKQNIQFDGGSFFGFPQRYGQIEGIDENAEYPIDVRYRSAQASELEPLFQEWLFFGFLHEVLSPQFFCRDDYISVNEDGSKVIELTPLPSIASQWMLSIAQSTVIGETHCAQLIRAAQLVLKMLIAINSLTSEFDKRLRNLIAATGEVVVCAVSCLYPEHGHSSRFVGLWSSTLARGVHESQASTSAAQVSVSTIALKTVYDEIDKRRSESDISAGLNTNQLTKGAIHRLECLRTTCNLVRVDESTMNRMCSILETDAFPLLELKQDSDGNIEINVVPWKDGVGFIAISHVWAQGMGNEDDNSLQECQVQNLLKHVTQLWKTTFPQNDQTPLFWLDTFCCPISGGGPGNVDDKKARADKRFKDLSLAFMRTVYSAASAVLVIDTELEQTSMKLSSPVELLAQLFSSPWVTRLWTLQEAALPEELWVQFKDHPLNLDSLFRALLDVKRSIDMRDRAAAESAIGQLRSLRLLCGRYGLSKREFEVAITAIALSQRVVRYQSDEPICLATLFDLDATAVIASDDTAHRMQSVWKQLSLRGLVTRSMAFSFGSKLSLPGYSWAWSTFLQQPAAVSLADDYMKKATITDNGLLIAASGIVLQLATPFAGFDSRYFSSDMFPSFDRLLIRTNDSQWIAFASVEHYSKHTLIVGTADNSHLPPFWDTLLNPSKTFALVRKHLSTDATRRDDGIYLLVEITGASEDAILCQRVCVGRVELQSEKFNRCYSTASSHVDRLRNHVDFKALERFTRPAESAEEKRVRKSAYAKVRPYLSSQNAGDHAGYISAGSGAQETARLQYEWEAQVRLALAGKYATGVTQCPETQQWCIG